MGGFSTSMLVYRRFSTIWHGEITKMSVISPGRPEKGAEFAGWGEPLRDSGAWRVRRRGSIPRCRWMGCAMTCPEKHGWWREFHEDLIWDLMGFNECFTVFSVCVCEIRYHSCGPEFLLTSWFKQSIRCRGPAHGITTLANEASDVMGSSWRRPIVYLPNSVWTVEQAVHFHAYMLLIWDYLRNQSFPLLSLLDWSGFWT